MRRTQTDISTKHKKYRRETQNMITTAQANMSSSNSLWQVSTVRNRTINNRTQTSIKVAQTFNEQILQEISSVFLNNEQGIIIRQMIELTRKGKINQHNSFEFPIKVIDPKCTQRITVEFWKLASEILRSSSNIYDKRVDNLSISSNKILSQLLRIQDNSVTIYQSINKSQSKQKSAQMGTKLILSVESLKININEVQFFHTESTQKLNFNQMKKYFFKDSLRLNSKGIDLSSTSGLMFNMLEIGSDLRIELYRKQGNIDNFYIQGQIKDSQRLFYNYIGYNSDFLSQSFHLKSFSQIGKYKDKHIVTSANIQSFQQIFQSINISNRESQRRLQPLNLNPQQFSPNQFQSHNFQSIVATNLVSGQRESKFSCQSRELFQRSLNTNLQENKQSLMITGPWEMQYRQMKLQKKNKSKNISKQSKKAVIKNQQEISFSIEFPQFRNEIFNKKRTKSLKIQQKKYGDKHLLPKTINPHDQIQKQRKLRQIGQIGQEKNNQQTKIRQRQQTLMDRQSAFLKTSFIENISSPQDSNSGFYKTKESQIQQQQQQQNIGSLNICDLKNIRQIKQLIYMHLRRQASLKISQFQCGLTPASVLIVFLHLTNQKNLQIQSIDNGFDAQLFVTL